MVKTDLTDEEKKLIIEALNNNIEPPAELMTKLFPGLAEKFDVAKLDRAKVVPLEYVGKRSEAAILNQSSPTDAGSPLQVERCFKGGSLTGETQLDLFKKAKDGTDDNWQNLIVQGDNLQFLKTCYRNADPLIKDRVEGKVKLIYIDPPETCTLIGDTTMKNSAGNDVHFKMLKFPYKILEDVSRNFQIQQQPSSQENVNNLINSTGFYFNDDVEIEIERIKQGLKITRFETKILDKQEKHLKGLDGLAIDKHGNESKPLIV